MITVLHQFLTTQASAIQTVAVVLGVLYLAWQTRQIGRQLKLSNITSSSKYFDDLNELLLRDERTRAFDSATVEGLVAHRYFSVFHSRFLLYNAHFMSKSMWASDMRAIIRCFREEEYLERIWGKDKGDYPDDFQRFIDKDILPPALKEQAKPAEAG